MEDGVGDEEHQPEHEQGVGMVVEDVAARAPGLGIPGEVVDGNDAIAVYEVVQKAIARARAGDGPSLIEGKTYRWRGHHEWDPGTAYRSQEEMAAWKEKCPIHRLETRLVEMGAMDRDSVAEMEKEVAQEVAAAVEVPPYQALNGLCGIHPLPELDKPEVEVV